MWFPLEILHYMYQTSGKWPQPHRAAEPVFTAPISPQALEDLYEGCADFESRRVDFGLKGSVGVYVCWLDGLVSADRVSNEVIRPLTEALRAHGVESEEQCIARILTGGVYRCAVHRRSSLDDLISDLGHGSCALVFGGSMAALSFELRSDAGRAVEQPTLEKSLKGAKDSFTEQLRVNTALIRRRISGPGLKLAESCIGRRSRTRVALLYMEGLASPEIAAEVARRLDRIDVDALLSMGPLEEALADTPGSPLPQLLHTERPDRFAMHLMDGRVGLLVDGLPVGLVVPVNLAEFMKVTGDSCSHYLVASSLTLLRYGALLLTLLLPGLYVAIAMYHQEMIPTRLLLSVIRSEQEIPFPSALEVLGMLGAFGLLQEAGLRLPNPVGDTVSIIGALIVGQAAVEAKLISPIAIIVVAVAGIAGYALPSQDLSAALRLWRLILLLGAAWAGLFGLSLALCLMLWRLCGMDSFGLNYSAPLSDGRPWGLWRLLIRMPQLKNKFRDPALGGSDRRRQP